MDASSRWPAKHYSLARHHFFTASLTSKYMRQETRRQVYEEAEDELQPDLKLHLSRKENKITPIDKPHHHKEPYAVFPPAQQRTFSVASASPSGAAS